MRISEAVAFELADVNACVLGDDLGGAPPFTLFVVCSCLFILLVWFTIGFLAWSSASLGSWLLVRFFLSSFRVPSMAELPAVLSLSSSGLPVWLLRFFLLSSFLVGLFLLFPLVSLVADLPAALSCCLGCRLTR